MTLAGRCPSRGVPASPLRGAPCMLQQPSQPRGTPLRGHWPAPNAQAVMGGCHRTSEALLVLLHPSMRSCTCPVMRLLIGMPRHCQIWQKEASYCCTCPAGPMRHPSLGLANKISRAACACKACTGDQTATTGTDKQDLLFLAYVLGQWALEGLLAFEEDWHAHQPSLHTLWWRTLQ